MKRPKKLHKNCSKSVDASPSDDETQGINIVDASGYPVLTFDADEFRKYVQDMGLTREQENERLEALWSIIVQFVNMGFGIEPVQLAMKDRMNDRSSSSGLVPGMETPDDDD